MNYLYLGFRIYGCDCGGGIPVPPQPIIMPTSENGNAPSVDSNAPVPPVDPWTNSAIDFPVGVKK